MMATRLPRLSALELVLLTASYSPNNNASFVSTMSTEKVVDTLEAVANAATSVVCATCCASAPKPLRDVNSSWKQYL